MVKRAFMKTTQSHHTVAVSAALSGCPANKTSLVLTAKHDSFLYLRVYANPLTKPSTYNLPCLQGVLRVKVAQSMWE